MPWFGPDISLASSATARLMETWAHGQDIYDALGLTHPASPGLRGIAHLGVATFAFSHTVHGLPVPNDAVRVELRSPTGEPWTWGPPDAPNRITGTTNGFRPHRTQRRNWRETGLIADGAVASGWLDIAQAFAGKASRRQAPPGITRPACSVADAAPSTGLATGDRLAYGFGERQMSLDHGEATIRTSCATVNGVDAITPVGYPLVASRPFA